MDRVEDLEPVGALAVFTIDRILVRWATTPSATGVQVCWLTSRTWRSDTRVSTVAIALQERWGHRQVDLSFLRSLLKRYSRPPKVSAFRPRLVVVSSATPIEGRSAVGFSVGGLSGLIVCGILNIAVSIRSSVGSGVLGWTERVE